MKPVVSVFGLLEEATSIDGCEINDKQLSSFTLMLLVFIMVQSPMYVAAHMVTGILFRCYSESGVKICINTFLSALSRVHT